MLSRIAIRAAIVRLRRAIIGWWWCPVCVVGLGGKRPTAGLYGVFDGRVGARFKVEVVAP